MASHNVQQDSASSKKYNEEDIILLIKFIVKEFAKIVQKWSSSPNPAFPQFGMNCLPQSNMNSLILSLLTNRENALQQHQDLLAQNLMQQININAGIDMLNQRKSESGPSTHMSKPQGVDFLNYQQPQANHSRSDASENIEINKDAERELQETKDEEVDTIQSSEDKSNRFRTMSEDTMNQSKKLDLEQVQLQLLLKQNGLGNYFPKNNMSDN